MNGCSKIMVGNGVEKTKTRQTTLGGGAVMFFFFSHLGNIIDANVWGE